MCNIVILAARYSGAHSTLGAMDKAARAQVKRAAETALRCLSQGLHVEALYGLLQLTRDHPEHVRAIKQGFLSSLAAFLDSINCGDSEADLQRFSRVAQDVCEVYSHDEAALTMLGVKCLDEGLVAQAQFFLEAALRVDPDCLGAKENLRALYDRMVMRWHFLMLNDLSRNMAYANAVDRAVSRSPNCSVLDIGSGTGILRCATFHLFIYLFMARIQTLIYPTCRLGYSNRYNYVVRYIHFGDCFVHDVSINFNT